MRQLEVRLKPWEARRLRQLRDHAKSARVLKRVVCLLLSAAGERATAIAAAATSPGEGKRACSGARRRVTFAR